MASGYDAPFYFHIQQMAQSLNRIANCLEAQEKREREKPQVDPSSLGALALWTQEVAAGTTLLGFADWLAWQESNQAETATPQ
jgi:hypothetical protein